MVAKVQVGTAAAPILATFLGDDDGAAGGDGEAGQLAARLQPGQENGRERSLAGLPLAAKQGDIARGQVAVPEPSFLGADCGEVDGAEKRRVKGWRTRRGEAVAASTERSGGTVIRIGAKAECLGADIRGPSLSGHR